MQPEEKVISYDRLEDETPKAWEAFQVFIELGDGRSKNQVGNRLGKSWTLIDRWAKKYHWEERIALWNRKVNGTVIRQRLLDKQAAKLRQLRIASKMQGLGEGQIDKHAELAKTTEGPILEADKASKIAAEGIKIERLIHGEPTDINENRNTDIDWSRLDAEEIQVFKALIIKLKGSQDD